MPLSVTLMTDRIYDAFYHEYTELKAFMHSHSYTGNSIACAIACESLDIFRDEEVISRNEIKSAMIAEKARPLAAGSPHVGEFRQLGMIGAVELVSDRKAKTGFDWKERVGYAVYKIALEQGVLLRPIGNVIYFMPPYIIEEKDIDLMLGVAFESIRRYFAGR